MRLIPDPAMENRERGIRGTRVEIIQKNGGRTEETVLVPKGDPENPLTRQDIIDKLKTCAKGQAEDGKLTKLTGEILNIGGNGRFSNPMRIL